MTATPRRIELLAPAKDAACGIEAIRHGADAVYIGAPKFSARAAAGNSVEDIRQLCAFAHQYGASVYVALNTLLKEEELAEAEQLIRQLYRVGVDALIIQDMGIMELDLPPIPLHASTQTDNRSVEKVQFLEQAGFEQVVLARELSLKEIEQISRNTQVALEAFVHGALCVSYSGQCYLSAAVTGRSANRGECAQLCRLPYTLIDSDGKVIVADKHLLSLKDMNRLADLEAMMDAGISSFKIEGRLKELAYVKNITAAYRKRLDEILKRRPEYRRASAGKVTIDFEPSVERSFNRGFTNYFLYKRSADITSFDTPKAIGEPIGTVKELKGNSFTVAGTKTLNNGDGLAFFNRRGQLEGFRVNRVESNRVFPMEMPVFTPKTPLFRNHDQAFDKLMAKPSAKRQLAVDIEFLDNAFGFTLVMTDETGARVMITQQQTKEPAHSPQQQENIIKQLTKLGNTPFYARTTTIRLTDNWFIASSLLNEMRRVAVERLIACRLIRHRSVAKGREEHLSTPIYPASSLTYLGNVANSKAREFYRRYGVGEIDDAFEINPPAGVPLMFTKHCIRYSLGICPVHHKKPQTPYKEPLFLKQKETTLQLAFDCKRCEMRLWQISD